MDDEIVIRLSPEDFSGLLLMMGYGMEGAVRSEDRALCRRFLRIANAINRDNVNWTPYAVRDEPGPTV